MRSGVNRDIVVFAADVGAALSGGVAGVLFYFSRRFWRREIIAVRQGGAYRVFHCDCCDGEGIDRGAVDGVIGRVSFAEFLSARIVRGGDELS